MGFVLSVTDIPALFMVNTAATVANVATTRNDGTYRQLVKYNKFN